ncbi:MAG TPA: MarR family winged helix-turn-helix transcriptional regulator [Acetobacteraceae bacterium]|nr:MarR family winged helix-turn-helix transcriptional regulator [Acetobacteraceae bacterium]
MPNDRTPVPADPAAVGRTFGFLMQDVARLLKRHFERRARQTGLPLTRRQAAVVVHVARREGVSQAEIAALLGMEAISLVRMLDKLCEEGLVERRPHPTDRRVRTLWLTAAAQPVLEQIVEIDLAIRAEAFAGLPTEARDALIDTLAVIKDNLTVEDTAVDEAMVSVSRHCGGPNDGGIPVDVGTGRPCDIPIEVASSLRS